MIEWATLKPYKRIEYHSDAVVEGGEEPSDDSLRDGVDQLGRELEEDGARRVRQAARADRRSKQLS